MSEPQQAALSIRSIIAAADPNNAEIKRDLSISHEKIGNMFARAGDQPGALAEYRQALEIDTKLSEVDPQNGQARLDRASSHEKIGDLLMKSGDLTGALGNHNQARKLREEVAAKDQQNIEVRSDLALTYKQLGEVCITMAKKSQNWERLQEAKQWYEQSHATLRDLQKSGALDKDGEAELTSLAGVIAECDAALKTR
jgi:tetratricopeptide (TPR) repeat protein